MIATGWRLQVHEALPSTSDLCRARAEAGEPEGLAILALQQTAGRGTQGRGWVSPIGNLSMSVLLRPSTPARQAGMWGLLAAVALAEAMAGLVADPSALRLKWPNDLLLGGAKLAGLLSEAAIDADGRLAWVVIGIGANLTVAPRVPDRVTACIGPEAPTPENFAAALLERLSDWRRVVLLDGFGPVRSAWLALGPALASSITVRRAGQEQTGIFAGLGEDGALLLEAAGKIRAVAAGET